MKTFKIELTDRITKKITIKTIKGESEYNRIKISKYPTHKIKNL